jgi:hypothetical protein
MMNGSAYHGSSVNGRAPGRRLTRCAVPMACSPSQPSPLGRHVFSTMVELVALRRVTPRTAAQSYPLGLHPVSSAAERGGIVAARQPLPLNTYLRRGRIVRRLVAQSAQFERAQRREPTECWKSRERRKLFPLPEGEGQGEGKRGVVYLGTFHGRFVPLT